MQNAFAEIQSAMAESRLRFPDICLGEGVHLRRGRIHELTGPSADVFALLASAKHGRDIVWIGLGRDIDTLCPAGLQVFADPQRLLLITGVSRGELLWAAEQALRAAGGFAVILDMPDMLSLRESRRLQLAAEETGSFGLIRLHGSPTTSAAQTRWHCEAVSHEHASWIWHCVKGKNGETGRWQVSHAGEDNATDTLHLAATAAA